MAAGHGQRAVQHALAQPARKVFEQTLVRAGLRVRDEALCEGAA
jgi:hypothetical protein